MGSLHGYILDHFPLPAEGLTLVADPDSLLLDEDIIKILRERGFETETFQEPVAFRYLYESRFRDKWDQGMHKPLIVVVNNSTIDTLPYDLLQLGRHISLSLADLFPKLSYPVISAVPREHLDTLYQVTVPERLGDDATKEFVLRHVFRVAPEFIREPSDLLRLLLRHHYAGGQIPATFSEHLVKILRRNPNFARWPLEQIVSDRDLFYTFLQERWEVFLDALIHGTGSIVQESPARLDFALEGPDLLPFGHEDIRVYINSLFLDDILKPISYDDDEVLANSWARVGIFVDSADRIRRRIEGLLDSLIGLPAEDSRHKEWTHFAYKWAELLSTELTANIDLPEGYITRKASLVNRVDLTFAKWVRRRYSSLVDLPPIPPVMVHHIPRYLARVIEGNKDQRVALILVDGLSIDQWISLRNVVKEQRPDLRFEEAAVFAWVPTITSVSRQATFAGKPPFYFPASIQGTHKEPSLWNQFWNEHGLSSDEIVFGKGFGSGDLQYIKDLVDRPEVQVAGLVVDTVDRIMHGMELGASGMHNQIKQWASRRFLVDMISLLMDNGFGVYLTSDHGNIEADGIGRPSEGAIAEVRGERVRVYPDQTLRTKVESRFPGSLAWDPVGLPSNYFPLIAPSRHAFVPEGSKAVGHGGITLEELIVPFVEIRRVTDDRSRQ